LSPYSRLGKSWSETSRQRPARDETVHLRDPLAPGAEPGRQGAGGRPVRAGPRGAAGHGAVRAVEGAPVGPDIVGAAGPAPDPDVALLRGPPEPLAARAAERHEGIDRSGMEPVGAEIEGVAA
jgi:hypothetical protein